MTRHTSHHARIRARRCVVQALYQWILTGARPDAIIKEFVEDRELIKVDFEYFSALTREIPPAHDALVDALLPALDREWKRIDPVEKAVLLVGTYELSRRPEVPWRVVVNEGVELCKMFGAEDAHRYINGVLDKIARRYRAIEIDNEAPLKT